MVRVAWVVRVVNLVRGKGVSGSEDSVGSKGGIGHAGSLDGVCSVGSVNLRVV